MSQIDPKLKPGLEPDPFWLARDIQSIRRALGSELHPLYRERYERLLAEYRQVVKSRARLLQAARLARQWLFGQFPANPQSRRYQVEAEIQAAINAEEPRPKVEGGEP